jgi:hypothetical protein
MVKKLTKEELDQVKTLATDKAYVKQTVKITTNNSGKEETTIRIIGIPIPVIPQ